MSLFVGNVSKNVRRQDLVDAFEKFGKCEVNIKGSFAFIEFDDERDAEDAKTDLNNKDMGGLKINIEWSKKSKRFDASASTRPPRRDRDDTKCYNCNKTGHFARDCRSRAKSRSRSRGRRDSRDRRDRRSRSRSDSRRRSSRGGDRDRSRRHASRSDSRSKRRRSHSDSRDRKRSPPARRSPTPDRRSHSPAAADEK